VNLCSNIFKTGTVAVSLNVDRLTKLICYWEEKKLCLEVEEFPVGDRYDCRTGCNRCCWNFLLWFLHPYSLFIIVTTTWTVSCLLKFEFFGT